VSWIGRTNLANRRRRLYAEGMVWERFTMTAVTDQALAIAAQHIPWNKDRVVG
jgi:hypothetical protein